MRILRTACMGWLAFLAATAYPADPAPTPPLIDPNDERLQWHSHRSHESTCVFTGTAVSEQRDDAFEVQFRQSRGQELKLFVIIPKLPKGGTVFMEAPTTRDRWQIHTENYKPALAGALADSFRRSVAQGIPISFTFDYGAGKRVIFATVAKGSITAAYQFNSCLAELAREALEAKTR
jgi:hypothetical protein